MFGTVRQLPSRKDTARKKRGSWQARYTAPDGRRYGKTLPTQTDAQGWLAAEKRLIDLGTWEPPKVREEKARKKQQQDALTVAAYFDQLMNRPGRQPTTINSYRSAFKNGIAQKLGNLPLNAVTRHDVQQWWAWLWETYPKRAKRNADSYTLLATIFNAAMEDELISATPVKIKGAGKAPDPQPKELLSDEEFAGILAALPAHYRVATMVASACALRIGEWSELRVKDVEVDRAGRCVLLVRRQVRDGGEVVPRTKSGKARRVHVPQSVAVHLLEHMGGLGKESLLFPNARGTWTDRRRFNRMLKRAGQTVGRPDVSSHDLRHYGATEFGRAGASVKEIQERLGHATPEMAMRYQHATEQRAWEVSSRMQLAGVDNVTSLLSRRQGAKQEGA